MINNRVIHCIRYSVSLHCIRNHYNYNFLCRTINRNYSALITRQSSVSTRFYYRMGNHNKTAHSLRASFTLSPAARMAGSWSMGPGTFEVPLSLFEKNRKRLASNLKSGQIVVLQGGEDINHYDTDVQYVFRQVSTYRLCNLYIENYVDLIY